MDRMTIPPPEVTEYAPYYQRYVSLVPPGSIVGHLRSQADATVAFLAAIDGETAGSRPAPDKWSLKEILGHITDTERIMSYRALRFARNDATPLPGFEQDDYMPNSPFQGQPWAELLEEYRAVRAATITLLGPLPEAAWHRTGTADGKAVTVRALAWIIAGHELHHLKIVREKHLR
jgi:hypothetical protein